MSNKEKHSHINRNNILFSLRWIGDFRAIKPSTKNLLVFHHQYFRPINTILANNTFVIDRPREKGIVGFIQNIFQPRYIRKCPFKHTAHVRILNPLQPLWGINIGSVVICHKPKSRKREQKNGYLFLVDSVFFRHIKWLVSAP